MKRVAAVSLFVIASAFGVARAQAPGEEVRCKDGTTSISGKGACSHHGGVVREDAQAKPGPATTEANEYKKAGGNTQPMVYCKDGTTATQGRGACSNHGGIAKPGPDQPSQATRTKPSGYNPKGELNTPAPAKPAPGAATARCKDGTMSYATHHSGACSSHGGVAQWLDQQP
jgi:hypothetical protein